MTDSVYTRLGVTSRQLSQIESVDDDTYYDDAVSNMEAFTNKWILDIYKNNVDSGDGELPQDDPEVYAELLQEIAEEYLKDNYPGGYHAGIIRDACLSAKSIPSLTVGYGPQEFHGEKIDIPNHEISYRFTYSNSNLDELFIPFKNELYYYNGGKVKTQNKNTFF